MYGTIAKVSHPPLSPNWYLTKAIAIKVRRKERRERERMDNVMEGENESGGWFLVRLTARQLDIEEYR